jgi:hypothetical protein
MIPLTVRFSEESTIAKHAIWTGLTIIHGKDRNVVQVFNLFCGMKTILNEILNGVYTLILQFNMI